MATDTTRGILNPVDGLTRFALERRPPSDDLLPFVERFWTVRWDLEGQEPFAQEILPYPCVNLSTGDSGFEVHGPGTQRFVAQLSGRGSVVGTKFTPAGFFAFASMPMGALVDRVLTVQAVTGRAPPSVQNGDFATVASVVEAYLRSYEPVCTENMALVNRLVRLAQEDRAIARAEDLARIAGTSVRSLHRLFERHVGVGPKWIVRRSRVQEAAERVAQGEQIDWAATAQDLGYHDQSHLIRDFRAQVGFTPAAYAQRCAQAVAK